MSTALLVVAGVGYSAGDGPGSGLQMRPVDRGRVDVEAGSPGPVVISALAGIRVEIHKVLDTPPRPARNHVEIATYTLDTAAAVEIETSLFSGGWVR